MPNDRLPKMSRHKASGRAVVRLGGQDYYLGPYGTKAARPEYDRIITEWLANGRRSADLGVNSITVGEVIAAFWEHAQSYYRHPDGTPTSEIDAFRDVFKPLRRLYGRTPAAGFGPLALKALRQSMISEKLCRSYINQRIGRIKRVFKWAVENELVPPSVYHGLQAVSGLKAGRSEARELEPVKPVAEEYVNAVLPHVSRQVKAMIELQLLTGMRPGEAAVMRGKDIDTSGAIWLYRPAHHKTLYLGHERVVPLGPRARKIIEEFLNSDLSAFLFSPAAAESDRRAAMHSRRKAPPSCGNAPGSNVTLKPRKLPGNCYTVRSYARAITYACDQAFPLPPHLARQRVPRTDSKKGMRWESRAEWKVRLGEARWDERCRWGHDHHWHPHQLRHSAATRLRKTFGLEPAQVILGHKTLSVTQVYAQKNVEAAMHIMAEVG